MKRIRKFMTLVSIASIFCSASAYSVDCQGCAYEGTRRASSISPLVAIGAVAIVAAIVVAVNDNNNNKSKRRRNGNGSGNGSPLGDPGGGTGHGHSHAH